MKQGKSKIAIGLFALYGTVMLWLLFAREAGTVGPDYWEQVQNRINLEPMHTIRLFLRVLAGEPSGYYLRLAVVNLLGNVVMFLPLGFLLPLVWPSFGKWWRTWLATLAIMIPVELLQLFTLRGSCDVDDLILNLAGAALGYGFFSFCRYLRNKA
ncbi:MAG: VanZ family protein [Oscillospiraceae bacterium]|nr:VanZ family protein [Oscillospiraceae bacterium]